MTRPGWIRAIVGLVVVATITVLTLTSAEVIAAAHPAYGFALAGVAAYGVGLLASFGWRRHGRVTRVGVRAWTGSVIWTLIAALLVGSLVWLRPFAPEVRMPDLVASTQAVRLVEGSRSITLEPQGSPKAGLVFQPGARVDARAYVPILAKVAAHGYLVVVVKQPLGMGLLAVDAPTSYIRERYDVPRWAVGGHSLGGVAASSYAANHPQVTGLVLFASYPAASIADRTGLRVVSISGSADGLATPAKIDASKPLLPATTTYVVIDGGVHAFFGDYGAQPGDGTPTTTRDAAQTEVVRATVALLGSL